MNQRTDWLSLTVVCALLFGMLPNILKYLKKPPGPQPHTDEFQLTRLDTRLYALLVPISLLAGIGVDAMGVRCGVLIASLASTLAMLGLVLTKTSWGVSYSACLLVTGMAFFNVTAIVLMPVTFFAQNTAASLSLGTIFFLLGGLIMPPAMDMMIRGIGLHRSLSIMAFVCLTPAILIFSAAQTSFELAERANCWDVLTHSLVWFSGVALIMYGLIEAMIGNWTKGYLVEVGYLPRGVTLVSGGFWLAIIVSRIGLAGLEENAVIKVNAEPWLLLAFGLAAAVLLGNLIGTHSRVNACAGILLLGLFWGPIFPVLVGFVLDHFRLSEHGTAYGGMFAIGGAGVLGFGRIFMSWGQTKAVRGHLRTMTILALIFGGISLVLALMF